MDPHTPVCHTAAYALREQVGQGNMQCGQERDRMGASPTRRISGVSDIAVLPLVRVSPTGRRVRSRGPASILTHVS